MSNEVAHAMCEEVQLFVKGHPISELNEKLLIELAMICASRTSEIIIKKLELMNERNYKRSS